ncbi:MAG: hypothetical protein KF909_08420 [Rhodocyclaceae bacterium]|nr:hypothetical protein [Rhodocyclaceae bacterium]MCP5240084.1 hypothetical protein [Zoogloeaceae bacterium]MCB1910716.1 hypothetical protein [Rhodocyclaceae bacterium]MCP5253687.1 hypothetical protein [Zoogloeaceae bacterium]MCP5293923.1 hypothetical protein [Zoogloeaceae bacterium]
MTTAQEARERYLQRIDGRLKFLALLDRNELALYLPSDEQMRKRQAKNLARSLARPNELPLLPSELLDEVAQRLLKGLEQMQARLPHDVQYKNRIRRDW